LASGVTLVLALATGAPPGDEGATRMMWFFPVDLVFLVAGLELASASTSVSSEPHGEPHGEPRGEPRGATTSGSIAWTPGFTF
jgi:hypothetical protein